jgi:hypothetical protein
VSDAGCASGTLRLRRKIPLLFGREELQTAWFDSVIFEKGSWTDVERLYFFARNVLVASPGV